jgi:hypothetical protein
MTPSDPDDSTRKARLDDLRARFLGTLDDRVAMILAQARAVRVGAWLAPADDKLLTEVHGLAGSAGLFGQERIGDAAAAIERLLVGFGKRRTVTAVDLALLREAARKLELAHAEAKAL